MWLTVTLLYHTTEITQDPLQLVLLGVVLEGTVFLFEVPGGVIADSYSRKWSVIAGLLLIGVAYMLEGSFALYAPVLVAQMVFGLGFTFYSGANDAWLADEIGTEQAAPVFVRGSQISLIAAQPGIFGAIWLGQNGLHVPMLVAGTGMILLALWLIAFMPENGFTPEQASARVWQQLTHTFKRSTSLLQRQSRFIVVVMVGVVVGLSVGGYDRLFTPHFLLNFTPPLEPVVWFGLLSSVVSLSSAAVLEWVRQRPALISADDAPRLIALLYGGTIAGNVIFVLAGQFWLAVLAYWFSQMLRATTRPLIIIWINQITTSAVRASAISMYWQSNSLGQIVGAPFIGLLGQLTSLRVALMSAVLALSPTLWLLTRDRTPTAPASPADPADPVE
jgi:DHA3 family tetracycline resistance protein-like MFS transporter